uniref:DRBM domain-containing protein n=1 Tax=Globodera rostochiensis TaxID=31243 RepID=A0A914H6U1_GLORO
MFNNNNNQITQQSCSVPMANAMGNSNGFDLLKISSTLPSPSAATFFAQPPPSSNVVKLFSNTISSPPPPPCSASTAAAIFGQKSAARSPTRGMSPKRAGPKSSNCSSSSSSNQAQRRSGSAQRVKSNSSHRRRAVHGHCGGGVAEPPSMCSSGNSSATTTTIRYNYAQRKDCSEKTPMCRLAELARANHLKHEYVLLDESGPAHCKNFTVKLVLCPGQEFEGTGASIKKAQQSAAQAAIDRCQLARPPAVPVMLLRGGGGAIFGGGARRPSGIRRDDQKSPICLLNSVAAQLGISLHYREECLINNVPKSLQKPSPTNLPPSFLACFLPQALYPAAMHCLNGSSAPPPPMFAHPPPQQQHRQLAPTALAPFTSRLPPPFGSSSLKCMPPAMLAASAAAPLKAPNSGAGLLPSAFMMPPPPPPFPSVAMSNSLSATMCHHPCFAQQMHHHPFLPFPSLPPPSTTNGCANAFASQHPNAQSHAAYKVIVRLSKDGTEHVGLGPSLTMAKQKAATLALAHLRPELEGLKRQREGNQHLHEQTGDEAEEEMKLMSSKAADAQHGVPGLETTLPVASSPACEDIERRELDGLNTLDTLDGEECQEERMGENRNGMLLVEADCCTTDDQNVVKVGPIAADQQLDTSSSKPQQKAHKKYKSVVSQIHECALQLRMNVEFEMVAEFGEPHNRTYSVSVRLISPSSATSVSSTTTMSLSSSSAEHSNNSGQNQREFVANGQGLSKKAAKQAACQKLLDQVKHLLELDPIQLASSVVRPTNGAVRRANSLGEAQKTEIHSTKRKTIIKDKKMDPNYGSGVNPVSRLIQVMQVRGARDPVFQVIGEHGQNRHKEFTVSVQCMDEELETGTGPNKKLAKRAAAEAMLAKIGYVKPMPQPGKSLLKKSAFTENINNNMNNVNSSALASPVKVPMPIIDVFVVPELDEDGWAKCPEVAVGQNLELAQMPTGMETFADVEQCFGDEQQPKKKQYIERMQSSTSVPDDHRLKWVNPPLDMEEDGCAADDCGGDDADVDGQHRPAALCSADNSGSSPSELGSPLPDDDDDNMHSTRRRRVTFSDTVRACPPPGATEAASIAPLKSELCTRPKRRLRPFSKDSQRMLSEEETKRLAAAAALFLAWPSVEVDKCGLTLINAPTTDGGTAVDEDDGELLAIALQTLNTGKQQQLLDDSNTTTRTTQLNSLSPTPTNNNNMNLRPNSLNMAPANSFVPAASLNLTIMNMASANNMNMMAANCLPTNNMNLTSSNSSNMLCANSLNMTTTSNIMSRMLANNLNELSVNGLNMSQSPMVPPSLPMFPVPPPPPPTIMPAAPSSAASGLTFSMPNIQHKFTVMEAKQFLEKLACTYHFTVVYSDFPKTRNDANEEQCFSLVTLGFAKPIVCHGSGHTKHVAHNDAALNAVRKCGQQMATAPENAGSSNK